MEKKKIKVTLIVDYDFWKVILKEFQNKWLRKVKDEKDTYILEGDSFDIFSYIKEQESEYEAEPLTHFNVYYETRGITIIPHLLIVKSGEKKVSVPKKTMFLLELLLLNPTIIHTRERLCGSLSSNGSMISDNALNQSIHRVKKVLEKFTDDEMIETVSGVGYRWKYEIKCFYEQKK